MHPSLPRLPARPEQDGLRRAFVRYVYADQNQRSGVRRAIRRSLERLAPDDWGLNLGCGDTRLHPRLINVDVKAGPTTDVITNGIDLPFATGSIALVVSQEVYEHVEDPAGWLAEAARVLRPGGWFYCQVPFIIGYHPGPTDFRRLTVQGMTQLFSKPPWRLIEVELASGPGTGFYRVAVEFTAVALSRARIYHLAKATAAVALLPLKLGDLLPVSEDARHRIPGGYYAIAERC